jgi:peroxiredoxin
MERTESSAVFPIGSKLPQFRLKNVDGNLVSSLEVLGTAKALVVVFTCNHCPYVKGSEEYLIETLKKFENEGVRGLAINSNDPVRYPEDSFEKMQEKARAVNLPYPFLLDQDQNVARAFDAACTPECFLFNGEGVLVYHGAINDSHRDSSKVSQNHLGRAIEQLLAGLEVSPAYVHTMGCSIKWS